MGSLKQYWLETQDLSEMLDKIDLSMLSNPDYELVTSTRVKLDQMKDIDPIVISQVRTIAKKMLSTEELEGLL